MTSLSKWGWYFDDPLAPSSDFSGDNAKCHEEVLTAQLLLTLIGTTHLKSLHIVLLDSIRKSHPLGVLNFLCHWWKAHLWNHSERVIVILWKIWDNPSSWECFFLFKFLGAGHWGRNDAKNNILGNVAFYTYLFKIISIYESNLFFPLAVSVEWVVHLHLRNEENLKIRSLFSVPIMS